MKRVKLPKYRNPKRTLVFRFIWKTIYSFCIHMHVTHFFNCSVYFCVSTPSCLVEIKWSVCPLKKYLSWQERVLTKSFGWESVRESIWSFPFTRVITTSPRVGRVKCPSRKNQVIPLMLRKIKVINTKKFLNKNSWALKLQ